MSEKHGGQDLAHTRPDAEFPAERARQDDEISLIDLWLVLVRRRRWLLGTAAAVFALGTVYAWLQPVEQGYTTTLRPVQLEGDPLVNPQRLRAQLEGVIVPEVRKRLEQARGEGEEAGEVASVEIQSPEENPLITEDTPLVGLTSTVPKPRKAAVRELHQAIGEAAAAYQQSWYQREQERIDRQITDAREELKAREEEFAASLEELEQRASDARSELEALQEEHGLLDERRKRLRTQLENAEGPDSAEAAQAALRELYVDSRDNREERGTTGRVLTDLQRELRSTRQEQRSWVQQQRDRIESLKWEREQLKAPEVTTLMAESDEERSSRRSLISALSAVLGLMLGVFGAFFREFLDQARQAAEPDA